MTDIFTAKQQEVTDTPLFLFDCTLKDGSAERWSTHAVTFEGHSYRARVLSHNMSDIRTSLDDGADGAARVSLTLANADSYFSQIEWNTGWKAARLVVRFVFFDLVKKAPSTDAVTVFQGIASAPDEITDSTLRVSFANRLNLQRVGLPEIRIQKRCPWMFPTTAGQRQEAVNGGTAGEYSRFFRCGYSPDIPDGAGNLGNDGKPFTACDYTRSQCIERGMFDQDSSGRTTRRFGAIEFVPPAIDVRSYGEKGSHLSAIVENDAKYNDFVPLVYGTAWCQPPVVLARNDGNLTRMEVLLAAGEIQAVVKVVVNDIEIPQGVAGADMTATGWYNLISSGKREGGFDSNFVDAGGRPSGDPYGSMAALSVVVPNRISNGQSLPRVQVLLQGLKLVSYDQDGHAGSAAFTNNPAWILLDVLRRSGWGQSELDVKSFATVAAYCDQPVTTTDLNGNDTSVPRYQCNLVLRKRRSAADVIRGIRNGSALLLSYGPDGRLRLRAESTLAVQQTDKPAASNSDQALSGGWPAYEFSDASASFSGILRKDSGAPHIRFWSRPASDSPNRISVEFQDEFNEYQQDSLSLVDTDDAVDSGQEVSTTMPALGLPNFDQAMRMARLQLSKSVQGNLYVEFGTSVRGFGLAPGDIITITYAKEGLTRQPFRITRLAPGPNYRTAVITAQLHEDEWYSGSGNGRAAARRQPQFGVGLPRPLLGSTIDANGDVQFDVSESVQQIGEGSPSVGLSVKFSAPATPNLTALGIPILSLTPIINSTGGTLAGGRTFYYAVSAVDANGAESSLSFTVKAGLPAGATNSVRLQSLSFSPGTSSFHVYRGTNPAQLTRISSNTPVADHFDDDGSAPATVIGPPDENYDHANFYWRFEIQPETAVTAASANSVTNKSLTMLVNENRGSLVRITRGAGRGQERLVTANTATTLSVNPVWTVQPDSTSFFVLAEPSWKFGSLTTLGPAEFDVPNRQGATVHILGLSANVHDQESAAELSPVTRWRISGAAGSDTDTPGEPLFAFEPTGQGTVNLVGVGFHDLTNTRTISSGTLVLYYWNEVATNAPPTLNSAIGVTDSTLVLSASGPVIGDILQVDGEIMTVSAVASDGVTCTIVRGDYHSTAAQHSAGAPVYPLARWTSVVPFARDFFGSPAAGSYNFPIFLPDVRIGAAALFVTNVFGNSPVSRYAFTSNADLGIRTLSGGQFSLQVDGTLAIQSDPTPPLVVEDAHSVRDISAIVREPATGGAIQVQVKLNGIAYGGLLTIPAGSTASNLIRGFGLPPLTAKSQLSLDILSVPQDATLFPGRDLTATIRT